MLISTGADPLDLQLWYALESATAFTVACMPYARLMMVRKINPYIKRKFTAWVLPSEQQNTSARTMLETSVARDGYAGDRSSVSEYSYPQLADVGRLLFAGDDPQQVMPLDTGTLPNKSPSSRAVEMSRIAEHAADDGDGKDQVRPDKLTIPAAADPEALRRYGFVSNAVIVKVRPVIRDEDSKDGSAKPGEADRRSL
ncbi:hypothetical protein ColLi_03883 [Colletotrichum liriopes]|uniref:Integral membrane protein n=1 Tax=Colletotrichum liriopes TaxID=708192 RepID=A0AA37GI41_9PEZI|nr:hypothetical protein ColLi_03883 [Colletotrichum liriopes]